MKNNKLKEWHTTKISVLNEYLKILIGFKKNITSIDARIHEIATYIAKEYFEKQYKNCDIQYSAKPKKGPDILISEKEKIKCYAEVVTNFNFDKGPEGNKLLDDVRKLIKSKAEEKYLIVLDNNLIDKAKNRCKNRRKDAIDLDKVSIQVISIEEIIKSEIWNV